MKTTIEITNRVISNNKEISRLKRIYNTVGRNMLYDTPYSKKETPEHKEALKKCIEKYGSYYSHSIPVTHVFAKKAFFQIYENEVTATIPTREFTKRVTEIAWNLLIEHLNKNN